MKRQQFAVDELWWEDLKSLAYNRFLKMYERCDGKVSLISQRLCMPRGTVYSWMKKLDLPTREQMKNDPTTRIPKGRSQRDL